jgi:proteic killer suppression protein
VIRSFPDRDTERVFQGQPTTVFPPTILKAARRKLDYLNQARRLQDLLVPAGNRLEALKGNRAGQWSIRINDQYRICFIWDNDAFEVEIVDYH